MAYKGIVKRAMKCGIIDSPEDLRNPDKIKDVVGEEQKRIEKVRFASLPFYFGIPFSLEASAGLMLKAYEKVVGHENVICVRQYGQGGNVICGHSIAEVKQSASALPHSTPFSSTEQVLDYSHLQQPELLALGIGVSLATGVGFYLGRRYLNFLQRFATEDNLREMTYNTD